VSVWPNWVDLIVVTLVFAGCYNGYGHGFAAEVLNLLGAVVVTAIAINYSPIAENWLRPWIQANPTVLSFVIFWAFFLMVWVAAKFLLRRASDLIRWERFHWAIQGLGLVLGGARGLWWAGLLLVAFTTSGFVYLRQSVIEQSVFGSRLLEPSRHVLEQTTAYFPGAQLRRPSLIPSVRPSDS